VAPLEAVNASQLLQRRTHAPIQALVALKQERGAEQILLSVIDLTEGKTPFRFLTNVDRQLVAAAFRDQFDEGLCILSVVVSCKELMVKFIAYHGRAG
jgi:hypothetical protein